MLITFYLGLRKGPTIEPPAPKDKHGLCQARQAIRIQLINKHFILGGLARPCVRALKV
jgi:hypothetical protein